MLSDLFVWYKSVQSIAIVTSVYLLLVTVGPWLMKERKPYSLRYVMMFYNLVQVTLCSYIIFYAINKGVVRMLTIYFCDQIPLVIMKMYDVKQTGSHFINLYYSAKILDLLDTVFIILKKKDNQLTFLHVYHHTSVLLGCWYCTFIKEDIFGAVLAITNTFVHMVMYCYYFLATMGPKIRKYLWWKKYLTLLQLVQFIIFISILVYHILFSCSISCIECKTYWVFNAVVYFALFMKFYKKSYLKKFNEDVKTK